MPIERGWLTTAQEGETLVVAAGGRWDVASAGIIDARLRQVAPAPGRPVRVEIDRLEALDTAGAWLLYRTLKRIQAAGGEASLAGARPEHRALIEEAAAHDRPCEIAPPRRNALVQCVERVGQATWRAGTTARSFVAFFGAVLVALARGLRRPARLRPTSLVHHMEEAGLNALPIVGLLSFLIGIVLAYQGAVQLRRFGAELFVVNLVAVSTLREIGILLTAIIVAGRSGSAFTAQIGAMKVNEEIDAMRTLGLDPVEILVLPRVLALVLTLPLLGFFADMMGLLGGGLMAWAVLDVSPALFIERLNQAVGVASFWVGIAKAPVFALLIALVGCHEGFQVVGSAESVGRRTTRAVVEAIFLVITADALFSVFFALIGV